MIEWIEWEIEKTRNMRRLKWIPERAWPYDAEDWRCRCCFHWRKRRRDPSWRTVSASRGASAGGTRIAWSGWWASAPDWVHDSTSNRPFDARRSAAVTTGCNDPSTGPANGRDSAPVCNDRNDRSSPVNIRLSQMRVVQRCRSNLTNPVRLVSITCNEIVGWMENGNQFQLTQPAVRSLNIKRRKYRSTC